MEKKISIMISFKGCGNSDETVKLITESLEKVIAEKEYPNNLAPYVWSLIDKGIPYDIMISLLMSYKEEKDKWILVSDLALFFIENPLWGKFVINFDVCIFDYISEEKKETIEEPRKKINTRKNRGN